MENNKNRSLLGFITFALGLVFGGLAAILFSTDESGKTKKGVQTKVAKAKQTLMDAADKERIKEVYGKVSTRASEMYGEAKANLTERVEELKGKFEKIDKEKYSQIVNDVVAEIKNEGAMTATQIKKLRDYFVQDYQKMSGANGKKNRSKKA